MNEPIQKFLSIEKKLRQVSSAKELAFIITNHSQHLLPYTQALVWIEKPLGIEVFSVSAAATINRQAPYIHWLEKTLLVVVASKEEALNATKRKFTEDIQARWSEYLPKLVSYHRLSKGAGVLFFHDQPWTKEQIQCFQELMEVYQYAWQHQENRQKTEKKGVKFSPYWGILAGIVLVILCLPVKLTILSSAQIAPHEPVLIGPSIEGTIHAIAVEPNAQVSKGQTLFVLDDVVLKNQRALAEKALIAAKERYRRAYQHAYSNVQSKAEIAVLKNEVEKKQQELRHQQALVERGIIRAPSDGVVIFSSKKEWLGKPVRIGEKVMLLAKVDDKQLDIHVRVDDMFAQYDRNRVVFYPNSNPLHGLEATVSQASFVPVPDLTNQLVFTVVADFSEQQHLPAYGMQGTAKIYGQNVSVFYYLFRRPLIFIQRLLGL